MKNLFVACGILLTHALVAQTNLPTSFSFDPNASIPTGWITYLNVNQGDTHYPTGSDATPACRLDGDGEFVRVNFIDEPGDLTYYLEGTGFSQAAANGTIFQVQESDDGTNWTNLRTFDENNTPGTYTQFTEALSSTTKWVRFYYEDKVSGSNIALDQIEIQEAPPGPEARISVFYGGNELINGEELFVGNQTLTNLTINNEGLVNDLVITNTTITGPQSADFTLTNVNSPIAATSNDIVDVNFTPSSTVYHNATLTIETNDNVQPTFVIELVGLGDNLAPAPTAQPTNVNFVDLSTHGFKVTWSAASPAPEKYLVLRQNTPILATPIDGNTYAQGDYIGDAQVAYVGSDLNFDPAYIRGSHEYYFKVFSFNGYSGYENYLTTTPAEGFHTTPYSEEGSYFFSIDWNNSAMINDLTNLVGNHTQIYYSDYISTVINEFEHRDTTNGQKVVTCSYSDFQYLYDEPFTWDVMSREHVYAHSWFNTYPAEQEVEYSDLHNLFPAQLNNVNTVRSNNPFGEVVNPTSTFMEGTLGQDVNGNTVYEPKEEIKGNVARAIFYMCVAYNGTGGAWTLPSFQEQQLLKTWHYQDPPDQYEITRNDYIQSVQNNRNPFVDHPEYVCRIDFTDMSFIQDNSTCPYLSVDENEVQKLSIYPNPSDDMIQINGLQEEAQIEFYNLSGQMVKSVSFRNENQIMSTLDLSAGAYIVKIISKDHLWQVPLVKK